MKLYLLFDLKCLLFEFIYLEIDLHWSFTIVAIPKPKICVYKRVGNCAIKITSNK